MIVRRVRRWAALALLVAVAGGCASGAWRWEERRHQRAVFQLPPTLPSHRAVERVTFQVGAHEFEFIGYRTYEPATRDVRAQLLLDSGLSVLDVAVHGDENER